jgi:hypothetical protein
VEHTLSYVTAVGLTEPLDTVVIPDAVNLVTITANVALRRTDDGSSWSDVWTLTPITTGHLLAGRHYLRTTALDARRGWQLRIYGSLTGTPRLSGALFLGARTELPTSPAYGCEVGVSRSYRGLDVAASWPPLPRAAGRAMARALAAVTPDAAESFVETVSGVGYGPLPHWLHDPLGRTLADDPATQTPTLLPVLCLSPEAARTASLTPAYASMPTRVLWRERR